MIPEPAPAQQQLDAWIRQDFTRECCAMARAADALLEHTQSPDNTSQATRTLNEMLSQHASIGQHFGWPNWTALCAHAQSLLARCPTDKLVRDWIRRLFHVAPPAAPPSDLLETCPVSPALGTSWQASPLALSQEPPAPPPWQQHTTDYSDAKSLRITPRPSQADEPSPTPQATPVQTLPTESQEEAAPKQLAPETTLHDPNVSDADLLESESHETSATEQHAIQSDAVDSDPPEYCFPERHSKQSASLESTKPQVAALVVFRAADQLRAIRADRVACVVRKREMPPQDAGVATTSPTDCDTHAPPDWSESTRTPPATPQACRFEIVLEAPAQSAPIPVQACFGVYTSTIMPVPETSRAAAVASVASIPGVGTAVVYDLEDLLPGTSQPPREPTE